MGLLFFVAGLFTPPALAYKGPRRFIGDRLWRLGVPTVAYLFVINPAMNLFGDRAMGANPMQVSALGRAVLDGLASAGVIGVVKHMPGHGRALVDSHHELPVVSATVPSW